jgi:hypothetical protein
MTGSYLDSDRFRTTNHVMMNNSAFNFNLGSADVERRNYKKKTPFTQWCNAHFNGGTFFNAPVNGI